MALAQKQTYGLIEQNREPRNKPTHLWPVNLWEKKARIHNRGKKIVSSASGVGKDGKPHINQ